MIWELHSDFNFQNERLKDHAEVSENLSKISTQEIECLKNKINFYLKHFSLVQKKDSEPAQLRINFLTKLYSVLENEILNRRNRLFI